LADPEVRRRMSEARKRDPRLAGLTVAERKYYRKAIAILGRAAARAQLGAPA